MKKILLVLLISVLSLTSCTVTKDSDYEARAAVELRLANESNMLWITTRNPYYRDRYYYHINRYDRYHNVIIIKGRRHR